MVNGSVNFCLDARNFGFECGDPRVQLFHRKRIEILPPERDQGIGDTLWKEIVDVHIRKVDALRALVNKRQRKT